MDGSYPGYLFRKIATITKDYIEKFENRWKQMICCFLCVWPNFAA
jgi:hypothetical protein